jgi:hypothetical protein
MKISDPGLHGSHAHAALHNSCRIAMLQRGRIDQGADPMGFLTELFSRPRPREDMRYRAALAVLNAMNNADRADINVKPADFPRIAREMSLR